jgi:hypothetical protein
MIVRAMNTQRRPWTKPGVIVVIAVVVVINLVVDWRLFRPTNWVAFSVVEAIILGGIIAWALSRSDSNRLI